MELQKSTPPLSWIFNEKYWWIFHIIFWMFVYLDEVLSMVGITSAAESYLDLVPGFIADILLIYFNIYYLLPKLLLKNRFWEYLGLTLLTLLINVFISIFDFQNPYDFSNPEDVGYFIDAIFISLMQTGIILMAAVGIKFFKSYTLNLEKVNELETSNLKTELAFLKNQINPHSLFNSLNNIYVQSRKRPEEASESILLLSDLLRYQLYDCAKEKVLLRNEIDYLKNYLRLDKMRKTGAKISFQVYGEPNGKMIAPFIFIPFVENAIKYGLADEDNSYVKIIFNIKSNQINFTIENSKLKMPNEQEVGGIGLVNVKRRLELIYPEQYILNIDNQKDKFQVKLILNLE